ncbi:hypothetical protein CR205_17110 [Alteribacter lacisalsi]|uniref:Uncharacterized protein n=1 Tax=Alteribacter lacisalsi TaxID=2045244 RepID=A0A2W0HH16_9BACI|nr:hypothetical protein CR205_17110 [Alteribacter lacisalsi]
MYNVYCDIFLNSTENTDRCESAFLNVGKFPDFFPDTELTEVDHYYTIAEGMQAFVHKVSDMS